ncbi:MAG TPA: TonB-dependent receptor [Polyangiaceae bacterium]|nr:TonB-dependent receptor [Polyangiaceae bacterium]
MAAAADPTAAPESEQTVEVQGTPVTPAAAPRDPSVAGSTVRHAELARPGLDAAAALRTGVGTTITETGGLGAPATASIRGATAAQTPVYLAGVRINDDVAGAADLSTLPLWLIDRVEVYRGNAPFEADHFGIGGAIFFEPIRPHGTSVAAGAGGGSYGSGQAWTYASAGDADHALLVGVNVEQAKNDYVFTNTEGTRDPGDDRRERLTNADASLIDAWLVGRSAAGAGNVDVVANHFEREQGAPRLAAVPTHAARQSLARNLASVSGRAPLGPNVTLELRTTGLAATSRIDDPLGELLPELGAPGRRLEQRGERLEQELGARFTFGASTRARVAFDGSSERLRRYEAAEIPDVAPALDAERLSVRGAAMAEHDLLPWLTLRALAAFECRGTSTTGNTPACGAFDPVGRAGAFARFGEFTTFANLGRYTRPPTLGELYGTSLVVHGNPALEPEHGVTAEIGARVAHRLRGEATPLYVAVSAYARRTNDLVKYERSVNYVVPENVGVADTAGFELESGAGFARFFAAELGLTLSDFRDRTPGNRLKNDILPFQPRLVVAPGLTATTPKLGAWASHAVFGVHLVYQSNRYADDAGLRVIPEQAPVELDAALVTFEGALILRARVSDVFDTERFDAVGFPLPGRSAFVSFELRGGGRE